MKQISAAMFLTAALSLGVSAFAQTAPTNPTGQVDAPTGQAAPQKPAELKDVPAGHWAQEAIKLAADCGIIRGYPDGTFRGNQPITRYEAAAIVARLISAIKSGACGIGTPGTSGSSISEEDFATLQNAVAELQADLAQLGVRVAELEDNAVTQDDLARVEELATQARDIAEQAATAAEDAQATADDAAAAAADAADAAQAAQDAADANTEAIQAAQDAADAAQEAADANTEAIQAAQDAADAAQEAADANTEAIQAAQDAADAAQEAADAAQEAADNAQATADSIEIPTGDGQTISLGDVAQISDIEDLQSQIDDLQAALDGLEPSPEFDPSELQGQIDDLSGTIEDLQAQIDDLNAQIADLGTGTATDGEPAAEFDPTELQDQIDDLNAQIADTQDQISELTDAVNAQQETIDSLVDTTAGLQDDVGTLQDTVVDLQDQIDALSALGGGDEGAAQDLLDQIDAAAIAADTALAQSRELQDKVDELDGRVSDLESGLGELGATVEGQADSIAALNDLVVLLNQDVLSLQDRVTQLERQVEDLSGAEPVAGVDSTEDIAALQDDLDSLREFTTLLRRDQTALADTVGDLEARVGALETKVDAGLAALDKRVSGLEANAFTISGSITLNYYVSRTWYENGLGIAPDFDVDRLGLNVGFSTGAPTGTSPRDSVDIGGNQSPTAGGSGYRAAAPTTPAGLGTAPSGVNEGRIDPQFNISFGLKPRALIGGGFPVGQITLTMSLDSTGFGFNNNSLTSITSAVKFSGLKALFVIGGAPLTITYGVKPSFKFSNYAFNSGGRGDGFVATLDGSSVLPLSPTLTVVYGSQADQQTGTAVAVYAGASSTTGTFTPVPGLITNLKVYNGRTYAKITYTAGVRGKIIVTLSDGTTRTFDTKDQTTDSGDQTFLVPFTGASTNSGASNANVPSFVSAVSFAPVVSNSLNSRNGDNNYFTGIRGTLSIFNGFTGGVYFGRNGNDVIGGGVTDNAQSAYGLFFSGKLFGFLNLEGEHNIYQITSPSTPANTASYIKAGLDLGVFSIGANYRFVETPFGTLDSDGAFPYKKGQSGFGIDVAVNQLFGFLDLSGYFDSRSRLAGTTLPNGPKQDTQGDPFLATSATNFGFGIGIRLIGFDIAGNFDGITEVGNSWNETLLAISARHDGSKSDALISNLNLAIGFMSDTVSAGLIPDFGGSGTDGTYNTSVIYAYADFALNFGDFKVTPQVYFSSTSGNLLANNITDLGGSLTVSTPFLFGSKLSLYGGLDQATRSGGGFTSSTSLIRFSIGWDSFLLPNSNFSVAFATRTDVNRNGRKFGPSFAAPIGADLYGTVAWGGDAAGRGGNLFGIYLTYGYYGLNFTYGIFNLTSGGPASQWGQEFSIGYKLTF